MIKTWPGNNSDLVTANHEPVNEKFMLQISIRDDFLVVGFLENDSIGVNLHHEAKISRSALKAWLNLPLVETDGNKT